LSDANITKIVEERWYAPLKITRPLRPLENNQTIHVMHRFEEEDGEDERLAAPPVDPLALFKDLSTWKPPRPSTPVHFTDFRPDPDSWDDDRRVVTHVVTSPHTVTLLLPKNASVEKVIEVFQRRTGLDGRWEGRIASDKVPRVVEIRAVIAPSAPAGEPRALSEVRVFFGTQGQKDVADDGTPDDEILARTRSALHLDEVWVIDRVIPGAPKNAKTIIAKWDGVKPTRQAVPDGTSEFIAIHVEKEIMVAQHTIRCKGGESPGEDTRVIAEKFGCVMDISDWHAVDGLVVIQVRRAPFIEVTFHLGDRAEHTWKQTKANNKHREKLASLLFG
jgi:hypothetical protein